MSASHQDAVPVLDPAAQLIAAESIVSGLEHGLDPAVEADLAKEVRRLVDALVEFGRRAEAIGKAAPPGFSQHVPLAFALSGFQLANSFLGCPKGASLLLGQIKHLEQLDVRLGQAFRKFEFGGREYLGVACIDDDTRRLLDGADCRDES